MSYMTVGDTAVSKIGGALKSGIDFYGQMQADKATADLARAQAAAAQAPSTSGGGGFPIMPIVLLGAAGVAVYFLFIKKKA